MSAPEQQSRSVKTLGVKLEPDVHAQLSFIAQLREGTITDEILIAIRAHIEHAKDDPELRSRAEEVQAEIEREAAARRDAIATLFAAPGTTPEAAPSSGTARSRQRSKEATSDN
ncbi:hypothetical protein [Nocardia gamkensis]|uniref:Uncharacterized protein n=1 Tax=Nocardia gamkensis TaxID=352869 RepID=A0A7X6L0H5_9NOCA|nr:hypothetical protein [Nocardia gamkensis]NKY25543.1 hypothetical protein [Nocardia gamkensis]NQE69696.1 hypothetical protein [Nocardia gamkensis]